MPLRVLVRSKGQGRSLTLYYLNPDTGREVTRSAGTKDKAEAERAAARWEIDLVKFRGKDGTGWDYARRRFMEEHASRKAKRTKHGYSTALNCFWKRMKPEKLSDITNGTLSQFQAGLLHDGYPMSTVETYSMAIRCFFNWAAYIGIIREAPKFRIDSSKSRKLMKGRPLSDDERKKMLAGCSRFGSQAWEWRRLLDLLWLSGFRISEALALSWDKLPVMVCLEAEPFPHTLFAAEGHKAREDMPCPIPPDFAAWLEKTPRKARRGNVINLLNEHGKPYTVQVVGEYLASVGKAAEIGTNNGLFASAHDFRRSFATRWAKVVRPLTLQKMMRHSKLETTLKYYVGLSAEDAGAELWAVSRKVSRNSGSKRRKAQ